MTKGTGGAAQGARQAATRRGRKAGPPATGTVARPRRRWWLAVAAGLVVLATAVIVAAAATPRAPAAQAVTRFNHVHGLAVPAWAAGEVFVATHEGLVRIDAEGRWWTVGDARHDFMGFQANPSTPNVLYASGHPAPGSGLRNPIGFLVSRDAGRTWQSLALAGTADFHAMAVHATNGDVVYGFNGAIEPGLYRTRDGGRSWERRGDDTLMRAGGAFSLAIDPTDPDRLLAGTGAGLLASDDGGSTWRVHALPGVPVTAVAFGVLDATSVTAYGAHEDVGLVHSRDGGTTWTYGGFRVGGGDAVGHVVADPRRPDRLYVGTFGMGVYRSDDGGATWQTLAAAGVPQ
jgi:photosystem II stability/assembly factor-like uncharacterized protein